MESVNSNEGIFTVDDVASVNTIEVTDHESEKTPDSLQSTKQSPVVAFGLMIFAVILYVQDIFQDVLGSRHLKGLSQYPERSVIWTLYETSSLKI